MASLGGSSQSIGGQSATEFVVRVPRNPSKRYNLMAFNAADKVDFSTWNQARMERDLSAKKMFQDEEMPDSGAGSEYNRKQRDESRRRKYGIILKEFKIEDQPWMLRVNGKAGRKFKGVKKGGVTENASYFIFTQCPDGAFEAFPVSNWYNFTPVAKHRTLTAEEAEQEWERRNKILNHFTIMQQRRLKDQGVDDDEEEGGGKQDKGGKSKKKKKNDLKIHDLEDDLELSSSESEESGEDGERKPKAPKKNAQRKKSKKSRSDDEAIEDSDDGDFEGQEVDYMSDGSSSDEELPGKPKPVKEEENHPKGIDEGSESSEESEEEKVEEEEEEEKKTPTPQEKKKKRDSSDESDTSEDSEIDGEASSALFIAGNRSKKKTPPKKDKKGGSNSSSRANSRPGTPSPDSGNTSNTLRAAANKLEQGKRGAANHTPAAKRLKMESGPQSTSGKSTPQPQSGKSTPSSGDIQLTEEAVRRYLTRKPMTTKDLLKKFQTKKTGLSSEQTVNVLAQILKRLNPDRKTIHDKMHFYLKE